MLKTSDMLVLAPGPWKRIKAHATSNDILCEKVPIGQPVRCWDVVRTEVLGNGIVPLPRDCALGVMLNENSTCSRHHIAIIAACTPSGHVFDNGWSTNASPVQNKYVIRNCAVNAPCHSRYALMLSLRPSKARSSNALDMLAD